MSLLVTKGLGMEPGASSPLTGLSATYTASTNNLDIQLSSAAVLAGPALVPSSWSITSTGNPSLTVNSISLISSNTIIRLNVSEARTATYLIQLPIGITQTSDGTSYTTPNPITCNATGTGPVVLLGSSIDAITMDIVFDRPVNQSDASTAANYTSNNGLTISAAVRVTDSVYRLTTSRQVPGTTYTLTIVGIHDAAGNLEP